MVWGTVWDGVRGTCRGQLGSLRPQQGALQQRDKGPWCVCSAAVEQARSVLPLLMEGCSVMWARLFSRVG